MEDKTWKEEITKALEGMQFPTIEHYTEPGISAWTIKIPGRPSITTGDAGMEMINKIIKEEFNKT